MPLTDRLALTSQELWRRGVFNLDREKPAPSSLIWCGRLSQQRWAGFILLPTSGSKLLAVYFLSGCPLSSGEGVPILLISAII